MPKPLPELTRAEIMAELRAGHVRKIEIEDQDVIIGSSTRGEFRTGFNGREDVDLPAELRNLGVEVAVSRQRQTPVQYGARITAFVALSVAA
jgi:hypothetical protein